MLTERRIVAVILMLGALTGCTSLGYLAQAAHGQFQLMRTRRPIEQVIADPASNGALKTRLRLVEQARDFAVTDLKLPDNRSYRTYGDLGRPYAVWNVVAAPEFSVTPLHWCFPFTGCISYRGYFHERSARKFAANLAGRGNDTLVAGVTAYSTLGHFADPVTNTMLRYGDNDMIATIFHELAHQLIYVPGDSQFSESFAMSVELEGLRRWLSARERSDELQMILARHRDEQTIVKAFGEGRRQLAALYAQPVPVEQMRTQKQEILKVTGDHVLDLEHQFHLPMYDLWINAGLNNAHLASIGTYYDCVPGFQRLLEANGGDLPSFYAAVKKMRRDVSARRSLCSSR
ncbi:MAG TPA: aminopeptidase [Steroidobacteraceae bacterium]|jgi:predicted aminopeptidase|nr:aminopeptidase [Steroidobacteraceae bacterium]